MDDKIICDCWVTVLRKQLSRHKKSKRHLDYINKKLLDLTKDEEPEEITEEKDVQASESAIEEFNDEASEAETSDNEEVVEVKENRKWEVVINLI